MPTPPATASEAYQQLEHEAHLLMDRLMAQPPTAMISPYDSATVKNISMESAPAACPPA